MWKILSLLTTPRKASLKKGAADNHYGPDPTYWPDNARTRCGGPPARLFWIIGRNLGLVNPKTICEIIVEAALADPLHPFSAVPQQLAASVSEQKTG